ncbi:molybdopterin-binding protein [Palleronia sp.]|uniref:molybdopterin-binding protein n=1 Tax=Palleronia sp. TaxID=1940284 RepID=UPI0035C8595F
MEFGEIPLRDSVGGILAHSYKVEGGRIRKGGVLGPDEIARLEAAGIEAVVVARPGPEDVTEDVAAARIAEATVPDPAAAGLRLTEAATGRVNLYATGPGVVRMDQHALHRLNLIDPMLTVATLPPFARVAAGTMVATVKIISYALPETSVIEAERMAPAALSIAPVVLRDATLIITHMGDGAGKGEAAVATRLDRLGMRLSEVKVVPHDAPAIAEALGAVDSDLALLLTASATSDVRDVGPTGLTDAGGTLTRFGMPVDPGNLLFYGRIGARPVIGLPGCARSPALNGADWVLERICCGVGPTGEEIAAMGVGGLLKESPSRPHPRAG